MKLVSTLALGLALSVGAVAATPAMAQKKAEAPKVQLSNEFRKAAGPVQEAIKVKNWPDASAKIGALDPLAKSPDEIYYANLFRYQIATGANQTADAAKAVEAMLNSGAAPADLRKALLTASGTNYYFAKNYPAAVQRLLAAEQAGETGAQTFVVLADSYFKQNNLAAGMPYFQKAVAAQRASGQKVPRDWYMRVISATASAKNDAETGKWMRALVADERTPENWRLAIATYRDSQPRDAQTVLDLYRLMRDTKSLAGERDHYEYAFTAAERGLPGEAKTVLDEGFATNQFSTGSRTLNELRSTNAARIASDKAGLAASERAANAAAHGRTALATGDAYLGYGENAKALAMYELALKKGGADANVVHTRRGIALARLGQKDAAKAAFEMVTGPRADVAAFWITSLG